MQDFLDLITQYHVLAAFWMTIKLTLLGGLGAVVIGTIVAVMRVSPVKIYQWIGAAYVTLVRNTPLTLITFFTVFGLYQMARWHIHPTGARQDVHAFDFSVIALAVYHASFVAEALRSGINTVSQGQAEAARAIGLDFSQSLREVILPQAMRGAIAPLGNALIALIKNTTVVATVGVAEMSFRMKAMIENSPDQLYLIFLLVALAFVILCLPTGIFFTTLSQRKAVQR